MTTGTTLVAFKQALRTRLSARPGLVGVTVSYAEPVVYETDDNMWFGTATGAAKLSVMRGGATALKVDEDYQLGVHIQAVKYGDDAQEAVDLRATELLRELQTELAETPQTIPDIFIAEFVGWSATVGPVVVEDGSGYASRFDTQVRVRARLT